jgi:hypothetical protein
MMNPVQAVGGGWRVARWSVGAGLLLLPLAMMQVVDGWNWGPGAFLVLGILIGGALLLYEHAARKGVGMAYRGGVAAAMLVAFLIMWMNVAVGIVGEDNPANFNFFMLIFASAVGAFAARGEAAGMARAMLGVAAVQLLLAIAIATAPSTVGAARVLTLCGVFGGLWLLSAALFQRASRGAG